MNTAAMTERTAEASPCLKARIAGVFYLLTFLTGGTALSVSGKLVIAGDAVATAANILAHEPRLWLGFGFNLIVIACYVVVTALFYQLLKPVNRSLSLVAAFFSLMGCAVQASAFLFYIAPLVVLEHAQYLSVFKLEQLQAQALMFVHLNAQAYNIGLVFFGFYCLLIGYLILGSTFLPRILGAGMMFAGLGWLTFLYPPLANYLSPYVLAPGIVGEGSLTLWLLVMGVNTTKWEEKASVWQASGT